MHVHEMGFEIIRPVVSRASMNGGSSDGGHLPGQSTSRDNFLHGPHLNQISDPPSPPPEPGMMNGLASPFNPLPDADSMQAYRQRELKWIGIMGSPTKNGKKIKKLLTEGVPDSVRGAVW